MQAFSYLLVGVVAIASASCGSRSELHVDACNDLRPGLAVSVVNTWPPPGSLVPLPGIPLLHGGPFTDGTYSLDGALELTVGDAGTMRLAATISIEGDVVQVAVRRDDGAVSRGTYAFHIERERIVLESICGSGLPRFNNFESDARRVTLSDAIGATTDVAIWTLVR